MMRSAYERWTWERCRQEILSLKNRLGYKDRLWILGFELGEDGRFFDPFHCLEVFDPLTAGPAATIPSRYSAIPEMYCLLSTYAAADDLPLRGEWVSLSALDPVRRQELRAAECAALNAYRDRDFARLRTRGPFVGQQLEQGDFAFEVWPLPRVPVRIILWHGDEELEDSGTLLFDRSATYYLPGMLQELAGLTVWRLRNILDPAVKWGYHAASQG